MQKTAITSAEIAPVLANRWSPRAYDVNHTASQHELLSILEAGRWAPSANNAQPWRYSLATRGSELHAQIVSALTGFNQAWAPSASALLVISMVNQKADGTPNTSALLDIGLTAQNIAIQTEELGLSAHMMAGFVHDAMRQVLDLADNLDPVLVMTIGKRAEPSVLEGPAYEREVAPRSRFELDEIVLHGKP
jgi:nitroreductase